MDVSFQILNNRLVISTIDTGTGATTVTTVQPTWDYEISNPTGGATTYAITIKSNGIPVGTYQYADFNTGGFFGHQPPNNTYIAQNIQDIIASGTGNPPAPPITGVPPTYRIVIGAAPAVLHNALAGTGGGAWTSSDPSISVSPLGWISGIVPGNATISFQPQGSYTPATTLYITVTP